ncbi:hypothetical protein CHCC14600_0402 [Bacillus licheniformis]|uniref:hypothetical protein n=1 Tax=Bacillus TaxID=1386 RepID=UPI0001F44393|nr:MULTISPECIES: hypothetical protein [Bacillus]EFV71209.1 hypothetical protein HMPREF1012_02813 [Bacillus sp. BT1B_CT2]MEC3832756.1 hypothetical protein [Bacillus licheniformis]MED4337602.1 hypothetical protein [Bacillus licheniformis]TWM91265.1 hypothetical protein CHCC14600_0402 [Bacillus licheniformis]
MEWSSILEWAFQRHLNPMSWYIRPLFLVALAYFCYRRSWKGVIITFLLMTSSMVWFPVPERINPEMQAVLDYELMLLSNPLSAVVTLAFMMGFLVLIGTAFWKRSLGWGLAVLNVTLIGKVVLSVMLTGENGWAPLGNTVFGLILVNGIGLLLIDWREKRGKAGR